MPEEIIINEEEPKLEGEQSAEKGSEQGVESPRDKEQLEQGGEKTAPEQSEKYQNLLQHVGGAPASVGDAEQDAVSLQELQSEEEKVEKLLDLAVAKGLPHAVAVASKMKDYYVLDRMHDDLVDKLYDKLAAQGLIEKG